MRFELRRQPALRFPLTTSVLLLSLIGISCRSDSLGPPLDLDDLTQVEGDLRIAPTELYLTDGQTGFFGVEVIRLDGSMAPSPPRNVVWKSSAPGIASVSSTGFVETKTPGTTMISAEVRGSIVEAVVVVRPAASIVRPLLDERLVGTVGAPLRDSVGVRVIDRGGLPVPGVTVNFTVATGGGTVMPRSAVTGADGVARTAWKLGNRAGDQAIEASVDGLAPTWIQASAQADGDEDQLQLMGGNNQVGVVDSILPRELEVRVVDRHGNPVANAPVKWSFRQGGAPGSGTTVSGQQTASSNGAGTSKTRWKLGTEAGEQLAVAQINEQQEVWFVAQGKPSQPKAVAVAPTSATLGVGQTTQLTATITDKHGNIVTGESVRWSSSNGSVATVDGSGNVRALSGGSAEIEAKVRGLRAYSSITVQAAGPARIDRVSGNAQSAQVGSTLPQPLVVRVTDPNGAPLSGVSVNWAVSAGGGSLSASSGTTDGNGQAQVQFTLGTVAGGNSATARAGGLSPATFTATGTPGPISSVQVTPSSTQMSPGQQKKLTALAMDSHGNGLGGTSFQWSSTNQTVASVTGDGSVTANQSGNSTVRATASGVSGTSSVSVASSAGSVVMTPQGGTLEAVGDTIHFSATAYDGQGNPIQGASLTWSSSNPSVVSVDALGRAVSVAAGTAVITVSVGCCTTDAATVTSVQLANQLSVVPAVVNLAPGETLQLRADVVDANGVAIPNAPVRWATEDVNVVTVSTSGLANAVGDGLTEIWAVATGPTTGGNVMAPTTVTVAAGGGGGGGGGSGTLKAPAWVNAQVIDVRTDEVDVRVTWEPNSAADHWDLLLNGPWFVNHPNATANGELPVRVTVPEYTHTVSRMQTDETFRAFVWAEQANPPVEFGPTSQSVTVPALGSSPPPPPPPPPSNAPALPQVYLNTSYQAPTGQVINVPSGGNLQSAINQAQPGDEIRLAAGAVYVGNFRLPEKSGNGWITITTNTSLPSEGVRMTPSRAGTLAKVFTPNSEPAFKTEPRAHHWRLMGLEIASDPSVPSSTWVFDLVALGDGSGAQNSMSLVPTDLIVDRSYIHGWPNASVKRGVALNSARTAIVDSYISEIHVNGADTQAAAGWNGPGPFKIVNNYLGAAGENLMFGGADPRISGLIPSDIEVRKNHMHKPISWHGSQWTVKNLLELKVGRRVLIDGNVLENIWPHAQDGAAIAFKSVNQDGGCGWCVLEDVTFRNNLIVNASQGINVSGRGDGRPAGRTARILIENVLMDRMGSRSDFPPSNGRLFILLNDPLDLTIRNVTAIGEAGLYPVVMAMGSNVSGVAQNFQVVNTILGGYPPGFDGTTPGAPSLDRFSGGTGVYSGNVMAINTSDSGAFQVNMGAGWSKASSVDAVGFVDWRGGNYNLTAGSPYQGSGANMQALSSAIAGAR